MERFAIEPGSNRLEHWLQVQQPQLWWPRGYGDAPLYELNIILRGGSVREKREERICKRIGFRRIELVSGDDSVGRSMFFRVNGRDIYARGANWIPVDAMPSAQNNAVYRRLLKDAAAANMNMIRLWGGGQYEKDIFYDLCDELGILIWHDMMFSCALYPAKEEFLAEVEEEARHQIKRLKDHPSIALWCGNNEIVGAFGWYEESRKNRDRYIVDYDRLTEGVIGRLVRSLDPERGWWPSSPSAAPAIIRTAGTMTARATCTTGLSGMRDCP